MNFLTSLKLPFLSEGNLLRQAVLIWVGGSAAIGGFISGIRKSNQILAESEPSYKNEMLEKPIRGVYHTCRIASHVGMGAGLAGAVALTAPISIPAYCYWRADLDNQEEKNS